LAAEEPAARLREALLQEVGGLLRVRRGQVEVLRVRVAGGLAHEGQEDERRYPQQQHQPAAAVTEGGQSAHCTDPQGRTELTAYVSLSVNASLTLTDHSWVSWRSG